MKYFFLLLYVLPNIYALDQESLFEYTKSWLHSTSKAVSGLSGAVSSFYCDHLTECCDEKSVPHDLQGLKNVLMTELYGQHIAQDIVLNAINSHINNPKPKKPLVMSFHGGNGVGKSYVSKMIARALYKKGDESSFFHFYYGLQDFPLAEKSSEYQIQLKKEVEAAVSRCERSLFVFDGVDRMPSGLLDALMPFIDCPTCKARDKKHKSIFIILTNTGSLSIQKQLSQKKEEGLSRQSTTLKDFEKYIVSDTLNNKGGLFESLLIEHHAIDFYVPFLPMEREHVQLCIEEAFQELNSTPTAQLVNRVFEELMFGPEPHNHYSNSGCKRVSQIAGRITSKLKLEL
ncbi:hypothetical protein QAD02_007002 [Eretmocerus hayati]|uniref:Uncharacterized protein n=1 Tax=Eretmocerus hayati TaxID=131215 RepID=A0ACC2N6T6_9HYME|nr:hypothetical protein QAD02_007002 [Eretmocerus hayati]